jgi:PKHD-type hydroxylase
MHGAHSKTRPGNNREVPVDHPIARQVGQTIFTALSASPQFINMARPLKVTPPMINRYEPGETYGNHIDGALLKAADETLTLRADLAATVFLSAPEEYDGGELTIEDTYGAHSVKLPAGDMILYPASSLHRVTAITRGARVGAFFWIQSMIRDDAKRALLASIDQAARLLFRDVPDNPGISMLHGAYANLLRMWTET